MKVVLTSPAATATSSSGGGNLGGVLLGLGLLVGGILLYNHFSKDEETEDAEAEVVK